MPASNHGCTTEPSQTLKPRLTIATRQLQAYLNSSRKSLITPNNNAHDSSFSNALQIAEYHRVIKPIQAAQYCDIG